MGSLINHAVGWDQRECFSLLIGFLVLATVLSVLGTVRNTPEGNGNDATRTWCISSIFCQLGEINDTCHFFSEPEKSRLGLLGLVWRVYVSKPEVVGC